MDFESIASAIPPLGRRVHSTALAEVRRAPTATTRLARLRETHEVAFMLCRNAVSLAFAIAILIPLPAWAGLYYSGENYASLPSQWRGYLLDQRALRIT